jgi:hypothetical protein
LTVIFPCATSPVTAVPTVVPPPPPPLLLTVTDAVPTPACPKPRHWIVTFRPSAKILPPVVIRVAPSYTLTSEILLWTTVMSVLFAATAGLVTVLITSGTFVATDVPPSLIRTE